MLKNTLINREATLKVARALGELNEKVVYVGGAVVSFYVDDASAEDVRPTKDVDISMSIASIAELEKIREEFLKKGFYQSSEDDVICRFRYEDIKVDLLATKAIGWAPANYWFEPGFKETIIFELEDIQIKCLSLTYYLATKFAAFYDRGAIEPRTSHDFEDIVYLLNYRTNLVDEIQNANQNLRTYLTKCFMDILDDDVKQEAILGNLFYEDQDYRYQNIIEKLKNICG